MTGKFHAGELAVQAQAGVQIMAARIGNGLQPSLPPVAQEFLQEQQMAVIASVDREGKVWASLLAGEPGFLQAIDPETINIKVKPLPGDPLSENLKVTGEVGLIVIEPATRRRIRINGKAELWPDSVQIYIQQAFSNCQKYIQAREIEVLPTGQIQNIEVKQSSKLNDEQQSWISQTDTFFIATFHAEGGADASHRGGLPGFVQVLNANRLVFPDYSGNKMFQTLGNLALNPQAGLLFLDFERGNILQLSGKAQIIWESERIAEVTGAERLIEFEIEQIIELDGASPLRGQFLEYSRFNPPVAAPM